MLNKKRKVISEAEEKEKALKRKTWGLLPLMHNSTWLTKILHIP